MDEEQLRLEYWEDNRTNREFPLWVIFKFIGHASGQSDDVPYLRHADQDLPTVLKALETHPSIAALASDLGIAPDELRAALWYCTWVVEHGKPPASWAEWNERVDTAWRSHTLRIDQ
jgi:hypothetical protein